MNHKTKVKLSYAICSPVQYMKLLLKGVRLSGPSFFSGSIFINKAKGGYISIGNNCRFMSTSWGNNIGLNHRCMLSTEKGACLSIGDFCSFSGTSIRCFCKIVIGNHVRIGANCLILDGDAHQDDPRAGRNKPIVIEDNVWLGGNVVVKKGVTIGRNSVVGINSVVTKDIPANSIAIGNPCVVVKRFDKSMIDEIEKYFE